MLSTADRLRPPSLGLRSELVEAAWNHGYRSERGEADGWLYFASDIGLAGEIGLAVAANGATWFLVVEHAGVAAELTAEPALPIPAGKRAAIRFASSSMLRASRQRAYDLAQSLPSAPLAEFEAEVASLGATQAEGLVRRRIGQDIFRRALRRPARRERGCFQSLLSHPDEAAQPKPEIRRGIIQTGPIPMAS